MPVSRVDKVKNQLFAVWKRCLSFRKREWELRDYPVAIRKQLADSADLEYTAPRFTHHAYVASIVNWNVISGGGNSPLEAMADLEKKFEMAVERRKFQGKTKPRPGVYVPLEFASQDRVRMHEELGEDFVRRVLDLEWAWISDESSLWNFHTDENNDRLNAKIIEVYGVDVSDLEDAKLFDILDRIASNQAKVMKM